MHISWVCSELGTLSGPPQHRAVSREAMSHFTGEDLSGDHALSDLPHPTRSPVSL